MSLLGPVLLHPQQALKTGPLLKGWRQVVVGESSGARCLRSWWLRSSPPSRCGASQLVYSRTRLCRGCVFIQ